MARPSTKKAITDEVIIEDSVPVVEKPTPVKKKYDAHDLIECRSITCGTLLMVGGKSKLLYKWGDMDETQEVEYQDLVYDVHSSASYSKYPRFIVLDDEFVEQNKLDIIYDKLYSPDNIREIINLPADQMKQIIPSLPKGAQEAVKTLAATMISNGTLDSIQKIKVLDGIFNTQMLLHLAGN